MRVFRFLLLASCLFSSVAQADFVGSKGTTLQTSGAWTQAFTVTETTQYMLYFATDYSAAALVMYADNEASFKNGGAINYIDGFDGQFGLKPITLAPGEYVLGVRNKSNGPNTFSVEFELAPPEASAASFNDVYFDAVETVGGNNGLLWHQFTIQDGFRYIIEGCNTGLKAYVIPASEFSNYRNNRQFRYLSDYSSDAVDENLPGLSTYELSPGDYYLAFINPDSEPHTVVYQMYRYRQNLSGSSSSSGGTGSSGGSSGSNGSGSSSGSNSVDDYGNSISSATSVSLNTTVTAEIHTGSDVDVFRVNIPQPGLLTVESLGSLDTLGRLLNVNGSELASNDDNNGTNFSISRVVSPGTYYIEVGAYQDNTGSYSLKMAFEVETPVATGALVQDDFNGDGASDVLLRNGSSGHWYIATMNGAVPATQSLVRLTNNQDWQEIARADFNGDNQADILMRHPDGRWFMAFMNGRTVISQGYVALTRNQDWQFLAAQDFNGDNKADILLRHSDGHWFMAFMDGRSPTSQNYAALTLNNAWSFTAAKDFNGDHKADILMRHSTGKWFLATMNGREPSSQGLIRLTANLDWAFQDAADYSGDGKADILLRHPDGRWFMAQMDGANVNSQNFAGLTRDTDWAIQASGDYSGDGKADVLLRHSGGRWFMAQMNGRTALQQDYVRLTQNLVWSILPPDR